MSMSSALHVLVYYDLSAACVAFRVGGNFKFRFGRNLSLYAAVYVLPHGFSALCEIRAIPAGSMRI